MKFREIELGNWKNFQKAQVRLADRMFLVGANASGKSNFLDAFRFLRDIVSPGGGFQHAVLKRGGVSKLRCLSARRSPEIAIRLVLAGEKDESVSEYELNFSQQFESPVVRKEYVRKNGKEVLNRPNEDDKSDPQRLTQTYLEQVNVNRDFRDIAEYFASIKYLHIVPQLVREPDRSVGRSNDPFGGDFLEQVAGTSKKTQESRLRRINEAIKVAVPQLTEVQLTRDIRGTPHLSGRYEHWRPHAGWQREEQFSDGTLRLIGLLWALMDGSGPLLLEEPELSLHPEVVRFIPQLFARVQRKNRRQIFVSSHSFDLLQDEGIGSDEILLLIPGSEGTTVRVADSIDEIGRLLEGGVTPADAVIPYTRPDNVERLPLFPEL